MEGAKKSTGESLASWVQYLGMTVSMLGGATWPTPRWSVVVAGLAVLCGGIVWARVARGKGAAAASAAGGDRPLTAARGRIDDGLSRAKSLHRDAGSEALTSVSARAEAIVRECVEPVAQSQESLTRDFGFAGYAQVMTPLATAERWLNRTWSAASDGHRPEAIASLERAVTHLEEAVEAARALDATRTPPA
jgi:hypothetical protein